MILLASPTTSPNGFTHSRLLLNFFLSLITIPICQKPFSIQEKFKREAIVLPRDLLQDDAYANRTHVRHLFAKPISFRIADPHGRYAEVSVTRSEGVLIITVTWLKPAACAISILGEIRSHKNSGDKTILHLPTMRTS